MLGKALAEDITCTQEWCWSDYQPNDKVFLTMSYSKCSLYFLDLLVDLNPLLSHPAFMATSPVISVVSCQYATPSHCSIFPVCFMVLILLCLQSSLCCCLFCFCFSSHESLFFFFFSSYIILQIPFQILVQFKLTKTISSIPNNLCSQLFQACSLGSKCGI